MTLELPEFVKIQNSRTLGGPGGEVFIVETKAAEHSALLRVLFEDYADKNGGDLDTDIIPTTIDISDDSLSLILGWMAEHKNMRKAEDCDAPVTDRGLLTFTEWEKQAFDQISELGLYELLIATNYLDIKRLHEVGCKVVANMIIGKSASEIREILNIENDFTPEEEEQIRRETAWAVDEDEAEATTAEAITTEATIAEATTAEATTAEAITTEATIAEATTTEATMIETTTVEDIIAEATTTEATMIEATTAESITVQATTVEATTAEAITAEAITAESTTVEATTAEATTAEAITAEAITEEATTAEATTAEATTAEATTAEATTAEATTA